MNTLIDMAISRSRTTLSVMLMLVLTGLVALRAMPVELEPDIEVPFVSVTVPHEGISPEDAERLLTLPLESELRTLDGLKELRSYSSEGVATITLEFEIEVEQSDALVDVRDAVDRARSEMPRTIEEPLINAVSTADFPAISVNFSGNVSERVLYNLARNLKDSVQSLPEVLEATISGHREEVLEVIVDPSLLQSYDIIAEDLIGITLANNRLVTAGSLNMDQGRFSVKVPGLIKTREDLLDVPVKVTGDSIVTLGQIASLRRTFKDRESYTNVNGKASISVEVVKRLGANLIDTAKKVKKLVADVQHEYPPNVNVFYTLDTAPLAEKQVNELRGNVLTAMMLVVILVVAALGLRSGVLVGLGIPVSLMMSYIFLYNIGYTFNFMVMFGMLLALGMLIDGAIVVTEYADRKMAEGLSRQDAYTVAAKRMFWPVAASTATTLVAFLPLFLWPGVAGRFMVHLPVTLFAVLASSLAYALFFGPTLGGLMGRATYQSEKALRDITTLESGDPTTLNNITGTYARFLSRVVHRPFLTTSIVGGVLISIFTLYSFLGNGVIFYAENDPQWASVSVSARGNLSSEEIYSLVKEVEDQVLQVPGIKNIYTRTIRNATETFRRPGTPKDQVGSLFIEIHEAEERTSTGLDILEEIRARTAGLVGIEVQVAKEENGPPVGKAIQVQLSSYIGDLLSGAAARIRHYMETSVTDLRDIDDTTPLPGVEWQMIIDRPHAARVGVGISSIGYAVQLVTTGIKLGEYHPSDATEEVEIRARFPEERRGIKALDDLWVNSVAGQIPLSNVVTLKPTPSVSTIRRIDGKRMETVSSEVAPDVLVNSKIQVISNWIDAQALDPRINVKFRGASEEQANSGAFLGTAFVIALLLMFTMLVTQFNSFYQATLIMLTVIMSTAGVLLGLIILGQPFSVILTGVGVVALAGIVVNNNIVLIDTYNHIRREQPELSIEETIIRTGAQRLRPVLLTTITTVFGLLPIAAHLSVDLIGRTITYGGSTTAAWVPLATAIVSGLTFATLLTLVATPAMLALGKSFGLLRSASLPASA